jgi:hypothetical protein
MPSAVLAAEVTGKVTYRGEGVQGVYIEVFDRDPAIASAPVASTNTGSGGSYSLELPAGGFYLTAKKRPGAGSSGGMLYGTSGKAPLKIGGSPFTVDMIKLFESGSGAAGSGEGTRVRGRVMNEGKPLAGAFVYFYPGTARRGPGYVARIRTDGDGSFETGLPPGNYTVTARSGSGGDGMGAIGSADFIGESTGMVTVGSELRVVPDIAMRQVDPESWQERRWGQQQGDFVLSGVVRDDSGVPAEGLYAFAYADHRMVGKPDAISPPTGRDGRFRLVLPGPGTYYLGARSRYGGPVEPGEMMGSCDAEGIRPIELESSSRLATCDFPVREVW